MSAVETKHFAWSPDDPANLDAIDKVRTRRKLAPRLLSNKWFGPAAIAGVTLLLVLRGGQPDLFFVVLLGLPAVWWAAASTAPPSMGKARRASPTAPRASYIVRLAAEGVTLISARLPDRLIPWSTLDLMEREGDRLVLLFRLAPLIPPEAVVVPRRAFSSSEDFAMFCSTAASLASKAGKTRLHLG
jgi:hypothetical protein